MGNRRRTTLFSKRGRSPDGAGPDGMGLFAGRGMQASRSPRESFRPLMEESPLATLLGDRPAPEPPDTGPSGRIVILIELACFVVIAFVAGSALLFYGGDSDTPGPREPVAARGGGVALLQQLEPAAAPQPRTGKAEPAAGPGPPPGVASGTIELPPAPPQMALAPEPRQDVSVPAAAPSRQPAPPVLPPASPPPAITVSPEEIATLVARGGELLKTGDIIGARLSYERAATSGSGPAATGVGKTYDPLYLVSAGVRGIQGDPSQAAVWYRKGAAAGDAEAQQRLKALQFAFPQ